MLGKKNKSVAIVIIFSALLVWWLVLNFFSNEYNPLIWAASYQILVIIAGFIGVMLAMGWGGHRSVMGKALISFALGAFFQAFGQTTFSIYNLFLETDIPYPSLADVGYFGSIPLYILGTLFLAQASGIKVSLKSFQKKLVAIVFPVLMIVVSYVAFLKDYEFDWSAPLRMLLDFGYPFGQAIYVSIAILTLSLSKGLLGGLMKNKIFFLLSALIVQYIADFNFLYQAIQGTWVNGGYGDLIYMTAYFLLAMSLLQFNVDYIKQGK
ncbi:MAG: hypothetical protein ACD_43C00286G0012 [uncultured bacterium]|nr:MAG: hypothetical protein ACD_43C00286G0012 [uncultured bacterium]HBY73085.1 hypothetical protein [Candidatus Kerfeldbacteria bacterium]